MTWLEDLTKGLGGWLAAQGIGAWNENGIYAPTDTAIVVGLLPAKNDTAIALTPYPVQSKPGQTDTIIGVQARIRAGTRHPLGATGISEQIFDVLDGARHQTMNGVHVTLAWRTISTPPAPDENGRPVLADTYYFHAARPGGQWRDDT
ncbi:hypothetical protein SAMN06309944_0252 [Micrococcales bacterium KH10]|nr:hypothetical protein SAMN06309944_0252 [Micrococcales bacterium KH10]